MEVALTRLRTRDVALAFAIVSSAVVFIGVPIWELLVPGPFSWHVGNASFWQGGLEAIVLIALVAGGFALNRTAWLLALVAVPALLYLRRHAVDAAVLVDVVYVEIIVGLGFWIRRVVGRTGAVSSLDYVLAFVSGFALWSVCAWTASACNLGAPKSLAWLTALLAIPAAFGRQRPLVVHLWRRVREEDLAARIWCGTLVAWLLVLFARSRVAIQADAPWYGLRGEFVLAPGHSVFESLALTSPVYYYPKIYEVFLLPITLLRDYSAIDAMSILLLLMLLLVCRGLLRELGAPARAQWPTLALVATLPALSSFATSPTPDVCATLFVVIGAFFAQRVVRQRASADVAWLLAAIALACSAKMTAIPFAGVMLVVTLIAAAVNRRSTSPSSAPMDTRLAWTTFAFACIAAAFVLARTLLLTGLPTIGPDPLFKLWLALGFTLKEPAGTLQWTRPPDWPDLPSLTLDLLFRPQDLPHIVVTWVGNVWLWLGMIALAAAAVGLRKQRSGGFAWPLVALMATGLGLALGNRYLVRGGDGNYFLFALVPAIVCGASAAFSRLQRVPRLAAVSLALLPAFVFFQAGYGFASGAWFPGTRAIDADFSQSARGTRKKRLIFVERYGVARIADFLAGLPHQTRVTGISEPAIKGWLPARFEDLETISYSRPEYVADTRSIRHFLRTWQIRYVIALQPDATNVRQVPPQPVVMAALAELEGLPGARRIDDRRYYLLDLGNIDADTLDPLPAGAADAERRNEPPRS